MEGDRCRAVVVENKSGRCAYGAQMFVDASGDADLIFRTGVPCVEEPNYLAYWFYSTDLPRMKKAIESGQVRDAISLEWRGSFRPDGSYTLGEKEYLASDAKEITRFILKGRRTIKDQIEKNREIEGSLLALPGMAQFRRTRRVDGMYLLTEEDANKHFEDSIGCTGHWMKPGIVYEIPFRTLVLERTGKCPGLGPQHIFFRRRVGGYPGDPAGCGDRPGSRDARGHGHRAEMRGQCVPGRGLAAKPRGRRGDTPFLARDLKLKTNEEAVRPAS